MYIQLFLFLYFFYLILCSNFIPNLSMTILHLTLCYCATAFLILQHVSLVHMKCKAMCGTD